MFGVTHWDGSGDEDPPLDSLPKLFDELLLADQEHGDVAVVLDSGWSLSAHRDGRAVFENLYLPGSAQHILPLSKERVLELWRLLIAVDIDGVLQAPWLPGYGP